MAAATHQVDHVLAEKHGGPTASANLALACMTCNRRKGTDISGIDPESGTAVLLFNPRSQDWRAHFLLDGPRIVGRTPEGRATVSLLQLNDMPRVTERAELIRAGRFHG